MHDSIRLEELGIPTAVVVTNEFAHEARVQRDALGLLGMEPVIIDHPLSTLSGEEINARAQQAISSVTAVWLK